MFCRKRVVSRSAKERRNALINPMPPLLGMGAVWMLLLLGISKSPIFDAYLIRKYKNKNDSTNGNADIYIITTLSFFCKLKQ